MADQRSSSAGLSAIRHRQVSDEKKRVNRPSLTLDTVKVVPVEEHELLHYPVLSADTRENVPCAHHHVPYCSEQGTCTAAKGEVETAATDDSRDSKQSYGDATVVVKRGGRWPSDKTMRSSYHLCTRLRAAVRRGKGWRSHAMRGGVPHSRGKRKREASHAA